MRQWFGRCFLVCVDLDVRWTATSLLSFVENLAKLRSLVVDGCRQRWIITGSTHLASIIKRVRESMVVADGSSEFIVHLGQWNCNDSLFAACISFLNCIKVLMLASGAFVPTWANICLVMLTKCISSPSSIHILGVDTGFSIIPSMTTSASYFGWIILIFSVLTSHPAVRSIR